MSHLLRLAVLTVLTFVAMAAYFLIPSQSEYWELASTRDLVSRGATPVVSIYIGEPRAEIVHNGPDEEQDGGARGFLTADPPAPPVPPSHEDETREELLDVRPAPEPDPEPPAPATREYRVRRGDNLTKIAVRELGSRRQEVIRRIRELNPRIVPTRLMPGQVLLLPAVSASAPAGETEEREREEPQVRTKTIVLKKGDTLTKLAARYCGDPNKWPALLALNSSSITRANLDSLPVGMRVRVPVEP